MCVKWIKYYFVKLLNYMYVRNIIVFVRMEWEFFELMRSIFVFKGIQGQSGVLFWSGKGGIYVYGWRILVVVFVGIIEVDSV